MSDLSFAEVTLPGDSEALRQEVRAFLAEDIASGAWAPQGDFATSFSAEFSRKLGARGWIGMTWPRRYGGHERSMLHRYVVTEELLAAAAPVAAHWTADRQSGPLILRYGTEAQCEALLPPIAKGECYTCIGMSEPDSGSDLASIRTRAKKTKSGWAITGTKVWTSHAHNCHFAIVLCRTSPQGDDRHAGLSQFIVDMASPGLTIRPITSLTGLHHFNEMIFDEMVVPDDMMLGDEGSGWEQVTSELAYERSGPDRFLSTLRVLQELVRLVGPDPDTKTAEAIGRLIAHLATLRRMSVSIAGMLERGETPNLQAAIVKELGTNLEQEIPELARLLAPAEASAPGANQPGAFHDALADAVLHAPSFTIRGGTREILRGIIARGLGLR